MYINRARLQLYNFFVAMRWYLWYMLSKRPYKLSRRLRNGRGNSFRKSYKPL